MTTPRRRRAAVLAIVFILSTVGSPVGRAQSTSESPDQVWAVKPAFAGRPDTPFDAQTASLTLDATRLVRALRVQGLEVRQAGSAFLPQPDGGFRRFAFRKTIDSMGVQGFVGIAADDPTVRALLTLGANGSIHAQVDEGRQSYVVTPSMALGSYEVHTDAAPASRPAWRCDTPAATSRVASQTSWGAQRLVLRLAIACTGEFARSRSPKGTTDEPTIRANARAGIVFTVQRLNEIYGGEFGIQFDLVPDNDKLILTDPDKDGLTNGDPNRLIDESQSLIDRLIGEPNYDIGHTLSTGAGGLAEVACVGIGGHKARGVTGRTEPYSDSFDVDYVAHEIGHQLGASHTFNGIHGSCGGNRHAACAYEPGAGSTIMAYAGICEQDNFFPRIFDRKNSDVYFHLASLVEIAETLKTNCEARLTPSGNQPPIVKSGMRRCIPKGTPFQLSVVDYSDPDSGQSLSFCWEELDLGPAGGLGAGVTSEGPLFRSRPPQPARNRMFPAMQTVLDGKTDITERLPVAGRKMRFGVTARDGNGGFAIDRVDVEVVDTAGPFQLISPASGMIPLGWANVKWTEAGTKVAPINCRQVRIQLSPDDGQDPWYDTVDKNKNKLHDNVGSAVVNLSGFVNRKMRLRVMASDQSFFCISDSFTFDPNAISMLVTPRPAAEAAVAARAAVESVLSPETSVVELGEAGTAKLWTSLNRTGELLTSRSLALGPMAHGPSGLVGFGTPASVQAFFKSVGGGELPSADTYIITVAPGGTQVTGFREHPDTRWLEELQTTRTGTLLQRDADNVQLRDLLRKVQTHQSGQ